MFKFNYFSGRLKIQKTGFEVFFLDLYVGNIGNKDIAVTY